MTLLTKRFLLAALLSAASSPLSAGNPTSSVAVDPASGDAVGVGGLGPDVSPIEFLQNNSPDLVLASTFPTSELHSLFEGWAYEFGRAYETVQEHALRKLVWLQNHARIEAHNSGGTSSYTMGHNDFSDLTTDEFKRRFYLGEYSPGVFEAKGRSDGQSLWSSTRKLRSSLVDSFLGDGEEDAADEDDEATVPDVPDFKNWTAEGAVTKVKNQWFCGACWAFSAVGAIEGARYIKTGNLTELSMQQLIDCDLTDLGCGGGLMDQAFTYDEDSVGLCSLEEYPFAFHRHWFYGCRRYMPYCTPLPNTKVKKFVDVQNKSEAALKAAIATQPVSVAVNAENWQFYKNGVFEQGCDEQIDHGILAVGYGHYDPKTDPNAPSGAEEKDYWLVKNSWGEWWGQNGYMKLARGTGNEDDGGTSCILSLSSRPLMKVED